jgi:hypothetical protein
MVASVVMIISGIFIFIDALRKRASNRPTELSAFSYLFSSKFLAFVPLMVIFAVAMSWVRFFLTASGSIFAAISFLWHKNLILKIMVTALSSAAIYVIFRLPFQVVLPKVGALAMIDALGYFVTSWLDLQFLPLTAAGTFAGIYVGAIPGLTVTMATSILISFTFAWNVDEALALIVGIYMGGVYGGSRTAILLNIPGAQSAIATVLDGYPLAKKVLAGEVIGLSTVISVIGGFVGILALAIAAPAISDLTIMFNS